jgi:hypothetical protein
MAAKQFAARLMRKIGNYFETNNCAERYLKSIRFALIKYVISGEVFPVAEKTYQHICILFLG